MPSSTRRSASGSRRSKPSSSRPAPRAYEALLVALGAAFVYVFTRSGNHSETEDSVAFAVRVRDAPWADLLEGTHLVYLPIARAFFNGVRLVGLTSDPLLAIQTLDALLAGAAIGAVWLLLRAAGADFVGAAGASGIAAFSYAFWRNAVDVEVYALSALALLACLAAAWWAARVPTARTFALLGVANGAAVLAHATNVAFAAVAAAAVLLVVRHRDDRPAAFRWSAAYAGAATAVVVPAYSVAALVHGLGSPAEFRRWFTERSGQPGDFGTVAVSNVTRGVFGAARGLVGGHHALALDPVREELTNRFAGKTFSEEAFFLAGFPKPLAVALLVLSAAAAALVGLLAARWLRRPALDPALRTLAVLAAAWLVPYAVFFLWWDPLNIELWYAVWLTAAILLAIPIARPAPRATKRVAILAASTVGALFVVNLLGSVLPQRDEERDLWRAKASWYRTHARSDDLIVSNGYVWSAYLRYLLSAEVVDIEDLFREAESERDALEELRRRIAAARGRVLVSGEAFHAFADRRVSCLDAPRTCEIAAATARELRGLCTVLAVAPDPLERVWRCPRAA
jgi:hypothetical protein